MKKSLIVLYSVGLTIMFLFLGAIVASKNWFLFWFVLAMIGCVIENATLESQLARVKREANEREESRDSSWQDALNTKERLVVMLRDENNGLKSTQHSLQLKADRLAKELFDKTSKKLKVKTVPKKKR